MSKVLENRRSNFTLASKKEQELTHLLNLAYHNLYKCNFSCFQPTNEAYYRQSLDVICEDRCYADFLGLQKILHGYQNRESKTQGVSELESIIDDKEECIATCFFGRKGIADGIYCIERCNEQMNSRMKKLVAEFGQALEAIV